MSHNKIKELRKKYNLSQEQMAEALHISQNAYSLIETGKTRLVDEERINIITQQLGVSALELGLFDGLGITENFNDKVESGYFSYIENLNANNKELTHSILEQLEIKDQRIEQLLLENAQLLHVLGEKKME